MPVPARIATFLIACVAALMNVGAATEVFSQNPFQRGWKLFNDEGLFSWNSQAGRLDVIWDSSRTNSYFYFPAGTVLSRSDDFSFSLDLHLNEITGGAHPGRPSTFQLSVGFLNLQDATQTNFFRGSGDTPNLAEFNYFPDTGFGPTIWPAIWSTNAALNYNGSQDYTLKALPVGVTLRLTVAYAASNQTVVTTITTNGVSIGTIKPVVLNNFFTDFRVNAFAVMSYSDFGQDSGFPGSIWARGFVDNIAITVPPPPVTQMQFQFLEGQANVTFLSRTNWAYFLESTPDLNVWQIASGEMNGTGASMTLSDTNAHLTQRFYRVQARKL